MLGAQGGHPVRRVVAVRVLVAADPEHPHVQQSGHRRQHPVPAQSMAVQVAPHPLAQHRQPPGHLQHVVELRLVLLLPPLRVVDVLLAPGRVDPDRLDVPVRMRRDPDVLPGRRDDQLPQPGQDIRIPHRSPGRVDEEPTPPAPTPPVPRSTRVTTPQPHRRPAPPSAPRPRRPAPRRGAEPPSSGGFLPRPSWANPPRRPRAPGAVAGPVAAPSAPVAPARRGRPTGCRTPVARWATPVSPLTTSRASATSAASAPRSVRPASTASGVRPAASATRAANARSSAEPVTSTRCPWSVSARASAANRSAGHRLAGTLLPGCSTCHTDRAPGADPGRRRPRSARSAGMSYQHSSRHHRSTSCSSTSHARAVDAARRPDWRRRAAGRAGWP